MNQQFKCSCFSWRLAAILSLAAAISLLMLAINWGKSSNSADATHRALGSKYQRKKNTLRRKRQRARERRERDQLEAERLARERLIAERVDGIHLPDNLKTLILSFGTDPQQPEIRKDETLGKLITNHLSSFANVTRDEEHPFFDFMDKWWGLKSFEYNETEDRYGTGHWDRTADNPFWGCDLDEDGRIPAPSHSTDAPDAGPSVQFDAGYPVYKKEGGGSVYYIGRVRPDYHVQQLRNRWIFISLYPRLGRTFLERLSKRTNLPFPPRTRTVKTWYKWLDLRRDGSLKSWSEIWGGRAQDMCTCTGSRICTIM